MGTRVWRSKWTDILDEYEHYQIETWVSDINRLMTTRNFILHDRAGNAIGKAVPIGR